MLLTNGLNKNQLELKGLFMHQQVQYMESVKKMLEIHALVPLTLYNKFKGM